MDSLNPMTDPVELNVKLPGGSSFPDARSASESCWRVFIAAPQPGFLANESGDNAEEAGAITVDS